MINREDMLALTRRMTVKRTSITRIAGGYMDIDGFIDGTFNTSFLKLNPVEQEKNLALAKKVPFAKTNKNLKEYKFSDDQRNPDSMWKLLMGMRACGLKNDALMETFYEIIGEHYQADEDYAIYVFHDRYDIPAKGLDHIRQGESERMYEYILCVICPLSGEYEPGEPECGFLFPAFVDGGAAMNYVDIYQEDEEYPHEELLELLAVRFVLDWNYAAHENLFLEDHLFEIPQYDRHGFDPVQIISSGPDSQTKTIHDNYLHLIHSARNHVYIQTPYFIPDASILDALKIASRSGVDVRIMIPCKPDHPFVYWATYSYIGEMVAAGAKCYVYNNGFLHAKTLSVDGMVACVGTANMDIRSFGLNFEVNATIYSERTVQRLERAFENDMTMSTQVTRKIYEERNLLIRFKEQFSRLLSPLL